MSAQAKHNVDVYNAITDLSVAFRSMSEKTNLMIDDATDGSNRVIEKPGAERTAE